MYRRLGRLLATGDKVKDNKEVGIGSRVVE